MTKIDSILDSIATSQAEYFSLYTQYSNFVNEQYSSAIDDMEFRLETVFRRERFEDYLKNTFDNRTMIKTLDWHGSKQCANLNRLTRR